MRWPQQADRIPARETIFCLVRHGETVWNREQRIQGHRDVPLSPEGRRQAAAVARRLALEPWDRLYCSDLRRARETAETIARHCGVPAVPDPRLRERNYGRFEGLTRQEIESLFTRKGGRSEEEHGVEPWHAMAARGLAAVQEWASAHPGERLILVTHGGWIRALLGQLFPSEYAGETVANTSLTRFALGPRGARLIAFNDTAHLRFKGE